SGRFHARGQAQFDTGFPQRQSVDGGLRVERGARAVVGHDASAALPHPRVPDEVLVVALGGGYDPAALTGRNELVGDVEKLVPGGGDVAFGESGLLEGRAAVVQRQRLDLHRQGEDLVADDAGGHVVREEVVDGLLAQVRLEVDQDVAVDVADDVAGTDQEDVRPG